MRTFYMVMLLLVGVVWPGRGETYVGDAEVVQKTYEVALKHFGFSREAIRAQKARLTPGLYALLWKKVNEPVAKGDAPDIEGDVFFDAQDLPISFHVEHAVETDLGIEHVKVTVVWSASDKRDYWVALRGAQIDDIDYGKDGTLRQLLK